MHDLGILMTFAGGLAFTLVLSFRPASIHRFDRPRVPVRPRPGELGNQPPQPLVNSAFVNAVRGLQQCFRAGDEGVEVTSLDVSDENLGMASFARTFVVGGKLLEQLLARTHPSEAYFDVPLGLEARQANEVLGQGQHRHRLPHVENEDFTALADGARLQNELNRLGDGHKIAAHIGVGHGWG